MKATNGVFPIVWSVMRRARSKMTYLQSLIGRSYLQLWGVRVGENLFMRSLPYCRTVGTGKIIIGDNVRINNKLCENPAGINHRTVLMAGPGAKITIADNVGISGAVIYATESVTIGDGCQLGVNSMIYTTDFHPVDARDRREHRRAATATGPVVLESDVWIGANAVILKGVSIGQGSVVAVGSIVTKDVPAGVVVAGNPAKVIRSLLPAVN